MWAINVFDCIHVSRKLWSKHCFYETLHFRKQLFKPHFAKQNENNRNNILKNMNFVWKLQEMTKFHILQRTQMTATFCQTQWHFQKWTIFHKKTPEIQRRWKKNWAWKVNVTVVPVEHPELWSQPRRVDPTGPRTSILDLSPEDLHFILLFISYLFVYIDIFDICTTAYSTMLFINVLYK